MHNVWAEPYIPSKTITSDFDTTDKPLTSGSGHWHEASFFLDITDITDNVELVVLSKDPASGNWAEVASSGVLTTVGTHRLNMHEGLDSELALKLKPTGGAPSCTFSLGYVAKDT